MNVEFDRQTCIGAFQCVSEWEAFQENRDDGKADLSGADETEEGLFSREISDDATNDAKWAARVCPVDAITVYTDEGDQLLP